MHFYTVMELDKSTTDQMIPFVYLEGFARTPLARVCKPGEWMAFSGGPYWGFPLEGDPAQCVRDRLMARTDDLLEVVEYLFETAGQIAGHIARGDDNDWERLEETHTLAVKLLGWCKELRKS